MSKRLAADTSLTADFFARDTLEVARDLVGVVMTIGRCVGRIVEVEAYKDDPASHTVTRRHKAALMRETFGHIYVYQIYGIHYCMNFTTERHGIGAVLIRAVEPLEGLKQMARRRGLDDPRKLATGPGCVCQAFGVDPRFHGLPIAECLQLTPRIEVPRILTSPRVGISAAVDLPWRFYEADNRFVSRGPAGAVRARRIRR